MFELKPYNIGLYWRWVEMALKDKKVSPFLSLTPTKSFDINVSDTWGEAHWISESGLTYVSAYFNRGDSSAKLTLHSVQCGPETLKKMEIFKAISFLFKDGYIFKAHGVKYIDFIVHGRNLDSLNLFTKRVKPWGIKPGAAYNKATGEWEDAYFFRLSEEDIAKRIPRIYFGYINNKK